MLSNNPPRVLLLAAAPADACRWAGLLAGSAVVWPAPRAVPAGETAEVVVTDLPQGQARAAGAPPGDHAAVIGIGPIEGADVTLDAEFTARELQLACRLLAEIVRLRIARDTVAASHQEVMQLAETDPLTGLANRRAWDRRLQAALARGAEHVVWLAVVDLDCFKQVNDRDGYAAGDRTLVDVARAMSEQLRRDDVLARLGGDEFGILLEGVSAPQMVAVLERVRVAVARGSVVSASIGYAVSRGQSSAAELTAAAQRALRVAKQSGGDRTCPEQSDTAGSSGSDKTAGGAG